MRVTDLRSSCRSIFKFLVIYSPLPTPSYHILSTIHDSLLSSTNDRCITYFSPPQDEQGISLAIRMGTIQWCIIPHCMLNEPESLHIQTHIFTPKNRFHSFLPISNIYIIYSTQVVVDKALLRKDQDHLSGENMTDDMLCIIWHSPFSPRCVARSGSFDILGNQSFNTRSTYLR